MEMKAKALLLLVCIISQGSFYAMDDAVRNEAFQPIVTVFAGCDDRYPVHVECLHQSPVLASLLESPKSSVSGQDGVELHLPACHSDNFKGILPLLCIQELVAMNKEVACQNVCELAQNDAGKIAAYFDAARALNFNEKLRNILLSALAQTLKKKRKGLRRVIRSQSQIRAETLLKELAEEEKQKRQSV